MNDDVQAPAHDIGQLSDPIAAFAKHRFFRQFVHRPSRQFKHHRQLLQQTRGNMTRAARFNYQFDLDKLGKPIDRSRLHQVLSRHLRSATTPRERQQPDLHAMLAHLAQDFVTELPEILAAIEAALADERWPDLRAMTHKMKGIAGSIGFAHLTDLAAPVEPAIDAADFVAARRHCLLLLDAARLVAGRVRSEASA